MAKPPPSRIFLSYRRGDTAGHVGRLHEELVRHFGAHRVFMDIDGIKPGEDFLEVLTRRLDEAAVVLVVMGSRWAGPRPDGTRRIDDPDDFVRLEVATALARTGTRLIPVLVDGARMPEPSALPAPLAPLTRRNAIELTDVRWKQDVRSLCEAVQPSVPLFTGTTYPVAGGGWKRPRLRTLAVLTAVVGGLLYWHPWSEAGVVPAEWLQRSPALGSPDDVIAMRRAATLRAEEERQRRREEARAEEAERPRQGTGAVATRTEIPRALEGRRLPEGVIADAKRQLRRGRRDWTDDAYLGTLTVECVNTEHGRCETRFLLVSESRGIGLAVWQTEPGAEWQYLQRERVGTALPVELDVMEIGEAMQRARAYGLIGAVDRVSLAMFRDASRLETPYWVIVPMNERTAGNDQAFCIEARSGQRAACYTLQRLSAE